MSKNTVVLLLGSNLNDRKINLTTAQSYINEEIGTIVNVSEIMETEPEGFESAHNFLNQLITIETKLSPISVLNQIKYIESQMGRVYLPTNQNYQDRNIDIDILTYNQLKFETNLLIIPHHQINSRSFVKKMMNYYFNR